MSLIPAFELGVWNAWILVLTLFVLVVGLTPLITKVVFTSGEKSADTSRQHNPAGLFTVREKKLYNIGMVITFASYIYSIFIPLKLGTEWFYVGLFVYLAGVLFGVKTCYRNIVTKKGKMREKWVFGSRPKLRLVLCKY